MTASYGIWEPRSHIAHDLARQPARRQGHRSPIYPPQVRPARPALPACGPTTRSQESGAAASQYGQEVGDDEDVYEDDEDVYEPAEEHHARRDGEVPHESVLQDQP